MLAVLSIAMTFMAINRGRQTSSKSNTGRAANTIKPHQLVIVPVTALILYIHFSKTHPFRIEAISIA
jgi:hypothetical protein